MTNLDVLLFAPDGSAATRLIDRLRGRGLSICVVDTEAELGEVLSTVAPRSIIVPRVSASGGSGSDGLGADGSGDASAANWSIIRCCDEPMVGDDPELLLASLSRGIIQRIGDLEIDLTGHRVLVHGRRVTLTATEFRLLEFLVRNIDVVVSKTQILEHVVGYGGHDANLVEVHISALRRKLRMSRQPSIETVRGVGYVIRRTQAA